MAADNAGKAGLHLLGGMPTGPVSLPKSVTVPLAGSTDWTALEVSARVAEHGGMVQFGVFLRGPGRLRSATHAVLRSRGRRLGPLIPHSTSLSAGTDHLARTRGRAGPQSQWADLQYLARDTSRSRRNE